MANGVVTLPRFHMGGLRSIAMSVSVCLSVCLGVCLSARMPQRPHTKLHEIRRLWPWLVLL